ncbi:hypothetical protein [Cytobacillus oceanisediminis]|uniref:hypothetical protein n=1 Tax=Cytobacillus oceanisediminis TaxID=665099 RepID=UPI001FB2C1E2|nr:hypothetical protein [Cytobacillus oceanisediminis]UOE53431.1 hypothetical protein IRB79_16150 [Cytobacillus oceanisediminis]
MRKVIVKFFMEKIWPEIQKLLVKYGKELAELIFAKAFEFIKNWFSNLGKEKAKQAEEAYSKAESSSDPDEKKKYAQEAEFYKREDESYARKMEDLERQFNEFKQSVQNDVENKTKDLKAEDLFKTNKEDFSFNWSSNILRLEDSSKK